MIMTIVLCMYYRLLVTDFISNYEIIYWYFDKRICEKIPAVFEKSNPLLFFYHRPYFAFLVSHTTVT